jgi:phenylacetate-CoA ligase
MLYQFINEVYGQLRGYGRRMIRRQVLVNARLSRDESDRIATSLFHQRVREAIGLFPAYAEKVRAYRGGLPGENEDIVPDELPVWTRKDQNALFNALVAPPIRGSFVHSTGGSTGVPTRFYVTRESYEWRMAVANRGYSWAGAEEGRRSYYIWGVPMKAPPFGDRFKKKLSNKLQRRRFFDSFLFGDDKKRKCCGEINRYMPESLVGYAGRLVELARFVEQNPDALSWRARTVVTAAEGLHHEDRELLARRLGDEVFMSYGSREFMLIGMECRHHGGYHISSDNLLVEVVDENGKSLPHGEPGRIVVTDLRNAANPFVRYEIGDLGVMARDACPCGLPFPILDRVEGRIQEVLHTTAGNTLTSLFVPHLMKEFEWVKGYQIIQEETNRIRVRLVCDALPAEKNLLPMIDQFRKTLGQDMIILFERTCELEATANGKTPAVIVRMNR